MKYRILSNIKLLVVLLFSISIQSCSIEGNTSMRIADVSSCEEYPIYEIFDSLEVISLEAHPDALIGALPRLLDCQDYYVIEQYPNFYIFEKNGAFVSSTKKILGHGKGEAPSLIGCSFNPYSKQIEILTFGKLLKYDIHLNFVSQHPLPCDIGNSKNLNKNSGAWFQFIYDLAPTEHMLIAGKGLNNSHNIFIYDSQKEKITWQTSIEKDVICSYGSGQRDCFFRDGSLIYIFPPYLLNQFYTFDRENQKLSPCVQLDFGNNTLRKEHIEPHSSKDYIENQTKIINYLWVNCDKHYPFLSAETNNRFFSLIHSGPQVDNWYLLEVNLSTLNARRLNVSDNKESVMPIEFTAADGFVYGLDNDEERIKKYIDSFKKRGQVKYSGISDTLDCSNAVILKYKVK